MDKAERRWVVYSAFDASGGATPHAVEQLAAYRELGFDTLVVDTSPSISDARARDWREVATDWFRRPNVGYDFMSFKSGLEALIDQKGVQVESLRLILANDSCFGPFMPMNRILCRFDSAGGRIVFGITDSYESRYHLQSYWLYFRPDVAHLAVAFLRDMNIPIDRSEAINDGELGLAAYLQERGCELRPYCSVLDLLAHFSHFHGLLPSLLELGVRRIVKRPWYNLKTDDACLKYLLRRSNAPRTFNPCLGLGADIFRERLTPFVKKQLLRDNPYGDPTIPRGLDVSALTNADVARILNRRDD